MKRKIGKGVRWAIVGDTQCPFHEPRAVELASQVIGDFQPDHIIYNGDMGDFWSLSKHNKRRYEILENMSLQDEIDITIEVQDKLSSRAKKVKRHNIDGNHEERWDTFLGSGPQSVLGPLKSLQIHEIMKYKERGFSSYHPYGEGIWITDNLYCYHGKYIGNSAGESVKKEIQAIGASIIMNHTHRRADVLFKQGKSIHRGIENGCLCQIRAGWQPMTNWTHCITLVTVHDNRHWTSEVVDIINDGDIWYTIYGDSKYTVPGSYHDGLAMDWRVNRILEFGEE